MTVPRLLTGVVVLSVAAVFVPAAFGANPDDHARLRDIGASDTASIVRPDDRAGPRGVGPSDTASIVRPDDRAGPRGEGAIPTVPSGDRGGPAGIEPGTPVVIETPVASTGIDWADPLVIAGLTALVAVAAFATAVGVVHYRHGGVHRTGGPKRPVTH